MVNDRQKVTDDLARLTQQLRTAARELAPTQPAASEQVARRARWHGRKRSRHPHAAQLGLAAQRRLLRSGGNRPHQRPAKAGSTGRRRGSRPGQRSARFRGRRAQPRHGRSVPSARPARRPRRERPQSAAQSVNQGNGQPGMQPATQPARPGNGQRRSSRAKAVTAGSRSSGQAGWSARRTGRLRPAAGRSGRRSAWRVRSAMRLAGGGQAIAATAYGGL